MTISDFFLIFKYTVLFHSNMIIYFSILVGKKKNPLNVRKVGFFYMF